MLVQVEYATLKHQILYSKDYFRDLFIRVIQEPIPSMMNQVLIFDNKDPN